jgi:hypothetical protein
MHLKSTCSSACWPARQANTLAVVGCQHAQRHNHDGMRSRVQTLQQVLAMLRVNAPEKSVRDYARFSFSDRPSLLSRILDNA